MSPCPDRPVHPLHEPAPFRLFIALAIPHELNRAFEQAQAELGRALREPGPGEQAPKNAKARRDGAFRWTKREQFHLTLRFLGNVPVSRVEELAQAARVVCRAFAPLRLTAARIGVFPNARRPRVIWVGISDLDERLGPLWSAVQSAMQPFTEEQPEREFTGHVTLGRINKLPPTEAKDLARAAVKFDKTVFGEWRANQVELMRSELLPQGARHTVLAALPLAGANKVHQSIKSP